ncbi:MAG: hypothetical protein WCC14_20085 [Acidobacteriaceae bacterium]
MVRIARLISLLDFYLRPGQRLPAVAAFKLSIVELADILISPSDRFPIVVDTDN